MKILLTGMTGFIGRHLSKRLVGDGHKLYTVIRNPDQERLFENSSITCYTNSGSISGLIEFFSTARLDGVVHCASHFVVEHTPEEIEGLINSNVLFSTQLLEASVKSKVNWFLNTGTFWQHFQDQDYSPVNLYSATKQAFESITQFYLETSEINFVTVKLNDTYGPGDTRPKIFNLWKRTVEEENILKMSKGEQYIDIVYIDDVVEAYTALIGLLQDDAKRHFRGKSFAVTSGNRMKLKDLATVFEGVAGKKMNIIWGARQYRNREVMHPWSKGGNIPGWKPKISIEEGIAMLLQNDEPE